MMDRYKLIFTVPGLQPALSCIVPDKHAANLLSPASHLRTTKDAVFGAGAGVYEDGKYVQVAFEITGQGQFLPVAEAGAEPHTGSAGQLERVLEYKVEILCEGRDTAMAAVAALKE